MNHGKHENKQYPMNFTFICAWSCWNSSWLD